MAKKKSDQLYEDYYSDVDLSRGERNRIGRVVANIALDEEVIHTSDVSEKTEQIIPELFLVQDNDEKHETKPESSIVPPITDVKPDKNTLKNELPYLRELLSYRRKTGIEISDNPTPEELIELITNGKDRNDVLKNILGDQIQRYLFVVLHHSAYLNELLRSAGPGLSIDDIVADSVADAIESLETTYKNRKDKELRFLPFIARFAFKRAVKRIKMHGSSMISTTSDRRFKQETASIAKKMLFGKTLSLDTVPYDTGSHESGANSFEYGSYEKRGGHNARRVVGANFDSGRNVVTDVSPGDNIDTIIDEIDTEKLANELLDILPTDSTYDKRDKEIILRRFGFGGDETKNATDLGKDYGLSRARVHQIEAQILGDLRYANMLKERTANHRTRMARRRIRYLNVEYDPARNVGKEVFDSVSIFENLLSLTDSPEGNFELIQGELLGLQDKFIELCLHIQQGYDLAKGIRKVPIKPPDTKKLEHGASIVPLTEIAKNKIVNTFKCEAVQLSNMGQKNLISKLKDIEEYVAELQEKGEHVSMRNLVLALEITLRQIQ